jgi:phospholipid/cholesterol/gamma-HCH transport system substrate-binding protein
VETRSPHWRSVLLPAAFALVCVVLLIITWLSFGGTVPFAAQGYRLQMTLPQATNIYPGTSVREAGITIGDVVSVNRAGHDNAQALIQLQPQFAPVRTGATAIVRNKTLLGEAYIELAPGPASAPAIVDGGQLAAANVQPQQQLFDVLRIFNPATRARIRTLFSGLAAALNGRSLAISDDIARAAPTTANLATIADTVNQQGASLSHLIADSGTVLSALGTRTGAIDSLIDAANQVLSATAERDRGLEATIDALPLFLEQLRSASTTLTAASPEIGAAAGALNAATPELVPALEAINAATPAFRTLFIDLPGVLSAGERGLPALDRILRHADGPLATVYTAARQLIPLLQLLSVDRSSVVGSIANEAQIQQGVMDAPGLGPVHYAAGAVTIWNESIAGWIRKLPTNRSNPYPAPNSELNIAHGGLKAYDCRNTGNPEYLPPFGTGEPKCVTQGPWTFDSTTAYYPRLYEGSR